MGKLVQASVSAHPSRTALAAANSFIDSSESATSDAFASCSPLRLQPQLAHDGEHSFLADDDAVAPELAVDPAVSVAALVKIEPFRDEALQGLPLDLRVGLPPLHAAVVFGFGRAQDPVCLPDGAELALMLFEEPAPRAWA